ncbi:MAG: hypothetical protein F4029_05700 [Gammaproteobacteria bacterium]|nr:hypothetical protein [Gammaproteobacteria bacterium]MXY56701.1 hypothetical protein [Gammaproteobacteria bacterium]MYF27804.1 hypothetical protein [Gammaproteobacteria bacterium]MYF31482.1 hypothetical protein [Gammaproteobacteria bacterium]MYK45702.1 hypothetical protein [Gammaproteobacteria bacterium]
MPRWTFGHDIADGDKATLPRLIWLACRIAMVVAMVVVPFGYATTALHTDVLMSTGCGIAIAVGVGVRGGPRSGPWTGVLVGVIIGVATALIAGLSPLEGFAVLVLPILALALGLIAGMRGSSLTGYRDVTREAFIVSVLLAVGFLPAWIAEGAFASGLRSDGLQLAGSTLVLFVWIALTAGLLSHRREGWRDTRPPLLLILGAAALAILLIVGVASGTFEEGRGLSGFSLVAMIAFLLAVSAAVPAAAFLLGRTVITWLEPRLRVYGYLADYLRVMWVPIGAFAVGYLTIIVLFAGFYGMLGRIQPAAFSNAGTGITEWLSFSFYTALGQDFATMSPVSAAARILVGAHLILSAGWAVVMFAAVMSSIGPRLDRIARRHAENDDD